MHPTWLIVMVFILISCDPSTVTTKVNCRDFETFDSFSRECELPVDTPIPISTSYSMVEDEMAYIPLLYLDRTDDPARDCTIISLNNGIDDTIPSSNCNCVGGDCEAEIVPDPHFNGDTQFIYTVSDEDGESVSQIMAVTIQPRSDTPFTTMAFVLNGSSHEEDETEIYGLGYNDPDGDLADSCTVALPSATNLRVGDCLCVLGICTVSIGTAAPNLNGNMETFTYRVRAGGEVSGFSSTQTVVIDPVNDVPYLANRIQRITVNEDVAPALSFTVNSAMDNEDSAGSLIYNITTPASFGTLSSCMNGDNDLDCDYTTSANVTDDDKYASLLIQGLRYRAAQSGVGGNEISIEYRNSTSLTDGVPEITVTDNDIVIDIEDGVTTGYQIRQAVEGLMAADNMVEIKVMGSIPQFVQARTSLSGGRERTDFVEFSVTDSGGRSTRGTLDFSIASVNDAPILSPLPVVPTLDTDEDTLRGFFIPPAMDVDMTDELSYFVTSSPNGIVRDCMDRPGSSGPADLSCFFEPHPNYSGPGSIRVEVRDRAGEIDFRDFNFTINALDDPSILCEYDHFGSVPECGLGNCIGTDSPIGRITPGRAGIHYYQQGFGVCFRSTLLDGQLTWSPIREGHISDQTIIAGGRFVIDTLKISEGGHTDEQTQMVRIVPGSISSSNPNLIPVGNISFYYGNTLVDTSMPFGLNMSIDDSRDFRMEMIPVGGMSGTSTIGFRINDSNDPAREVSYSFDATVNPVMARHGGWSDILAIGRKVNQFDNILDGKKVCSFSRNKCDSGNDCTGTAPPSSSLQADDDHTIYWDSTSELCYYSEESGDDTNWQIFDVYCNISPSEYDSGCSGSSCVIDQSAVSTWSPERRDNFYYAVDGNGNGICYRSIGTSPGELRSYRAVAEVFLQWNDFEILDGITGVINGFNIYRRLGMTGETFDYNSPINKNPVTTNHYLDNGINSWTAPVPRTVYFYEVRPVFGDMLSDTNEDFKTLRVVTPPENMVFVHRWMANQEICGKMGKTSDSSHHYRCPYNGPGQIGGFYDIGQHLLVDRFEAGCPYSQSQGCSADSLTCLGRNSPDGMVTATSGSVYYDRASGRCYGNTSVTAMGDDWNEISADCPYTRGSTVCGGGSCQGNSSPDGSIPAPGGTVYYDQMADICYTNTAVSGTTGTDWNGKRVAANFPLSHRMPELPPLVYFSQQEAHNLCTGNEINTRLDNEDWFLGLTSNPQSGRLPSRLEQMAYSMWFPATSGYIQALEKGRSLDVSSGCNSSSAHGLTSSYSNNDIPGSESFFTLPGTAVSSIRSFMTGSEKTGVCSGRFGVQDAVGNVAEFSSDRFRCTNSYECEGIYSGNVQSSPYPDISRLSQRDDMNSLDSDFGHYRLDGVRGPCRDRDYDGNCDALMTSWTLKSKKYRSTRFILPLGLPAHRDFLHDYSSSLLAMADPDGSDLLQIGSSDGITRPELHSDTVDFNTESIYQGVQGCGAVVSGGGYQDMGAAGVYYLKLLPCHHGAWLFEHDAFDFDVRGLDREHNFDFQVQIGTGSVGVSMDSTRITLNMNTQTTVEQVVDAINTNTDVNDLIRATPSDQATGSLSLLDLTAVSAPTSVPDFSLQEDSTLTAPNLATVSVNAQGEIVLTVNPGTTTLNDIIDVVNDDLLISTLVEVDAIGTENRTVDLARVVDNTMLVANVKEDIPTSLPDVRMVERHTTSPPFAGFTFIRNYNSGVVSGYLSGGILIGLSLNDPNNSYQNLALAMNTFDQGPHLFHRDYNVSDYFDTRLISTTSTPPLVSAAAIGFMAQLPTTEYTYEWIPQQGTTLRILSIIPDPLDFSRRQITLEVPPNTTLQSLANLINNDPIAGLLVSVSVSGNANAVMFNDMTFTRTQVQDRGKRVDTGFRCVHSLQNNIFDEPVVP